MSDVLHFYGENIPSFVRLKTDDPAGAAPEYEYDVIDLTALLGRTRADAGGRIVLPDGVSYALLSIPPHDAFGLPALRLEGLYLSLATFALGVALPQILKYKGFEHWTGGAQGIVINKPDPPAWASLTQDQWLYFVALAVAVAMFVLGWNLLRGRIGRAMVAIRDQPIAAQDRGQKCPQP